MRTVESIQRLSRRRTRGISGTILFHGFGQRPSLILVKSAQQWIRETNIFLNVSTPRTLTCSSLNYHKVYRLHWICARARAQQWNEELKITQFEMEWVVRWFMHMADKWVKYRDSAEEAVRGLCPFAECNIATWDELGRVAELTFKRINSSYIPLWTSRS